MRLTTTTPQDTHGAFLRQWVHACRADQGLSHRHRVRMWQGSQGGDTGEVAVYRNFKRYFANAAARTTRRIPLVSFFSPTKHFACILYICAVWHPRPWLSPPGL